MKITNNKDLRDLNTFHVAARSRWFAEVGSAEEFRIVLQDERYHQNEKLILGGGSNILFTQDFNGLVIKNNFKGRELIREDEHHVVYRVGAGENWHDFVMFIVRQNLGGIENLSLIPGNVGASPMQNIGAYGVEIKDVVELVETLDMETGEAQSFGAEECAFGYRTSIFKTRLKGKKLITHVTYRLSKQPDLNTSYGSIAQELETMSIVHPSVQDVSEAVIRIRRSKLPDPAQIGNAGSFFKNPVVSEKHAKELQDKYPEMPIYPAEMGYMKIPAGWLIEKAGWKGRRMNDQGVHDKQALVLVNYNNAKGSDIFQLSEDIANDVKASFGISLEREVNII